MAEGAACAMLPRKGCAVGRRGIKEYRAPEALVLIALDRDRKPLVCPSCGSTEVRRTPRRAEDVGGRVTMACSACGRSACYIESASGPVVSPEAPNPYVH